MSNTSRSKHSTEGVEILSMAYYESAIDIIYSFRRYYEWLTETKGTFSQEDSEMVTQNIVNIRNNLYSLASSVLLQVGDFDESMSIEERKQWAVDKVFDDTAREKWANQE